MKVFLARDKTAGHYNAGPHASFAPISHCILDCHPVARQLHVRRSGGRAGATLPVQHTCGRCEHRFEERRGRGGEARSA